MSDQLKQLQQDFNRYYTKVNSLAEANTPLTAHDLLEQLIQVLPYGVTITEVNLLINQLQIERKLIGQDYYLLISAK